MYQKKSFVYTQTIDDIVNRIIAQVIRVAGPDVLRSVLGNRSSTPRTSIDADFDDDEDDDDAGTNNSIDNDSKSTTEANGNGGNGDESRVKIDLPTFPPETSADKSNVSPTTFATRSSIPSTNPTTTTTTTSSPTTTTSTTTTTTTTTEIPTTTTSTTTPSSPIYIVPQRSTRENPTTTPESITTVASTTPTVIQTSFNRNPQISDIILTDPLYSSSPNASNVDSLPAAVENNLNSNTTPLAEAGDESQLMRIIDNLNRLLNRTNYFIVSRDNYSSPPTTIITGKGTGTTATPDLTTPKITKLLPVNAN